MGLLLPWSLAAAQTVSVAARGRFDLATIAGRVCEDTDRNGVCGAEEPGIGGVAIYLDTGAFAVTDRDGRYHLRAVEGRSVLGAGHWEALGRHLVKIDLSPLGPFAEAGGGATRVIDVSAAALVALDFPIAVAFSELRPLAGYLGVGELEGESRIFRIAARPGPVHRLWVQGREVPIDPEGEVEARIEVEAGDNRLSFVDLSPEGQLTVHLQTLSVLQRERGGTLFVPSLAMPTVRVDLPPPGAPPGKTAIPVQGPPDTRIALGEDTILIGPSGRGELRTQVPPGEIRLELRIEPPGERPLRIPVTLVSGSHAFGMGLVGAELHFAPGTRAFNLLGWGAGHLGYERGDWSLRMGLQLDNTERWDRADSPWRAFLEPRERFVFDWAPDLSRVPLVAGDEAEEGSLNPSDARLWGRLAHAKIGSLELGPVRPDLGGEMLGQWRRALNGAQLDAGAEVGAVTGRVKAFGAMGGVSWDSSGVAPAAFAAHDLFEGTGGSLFFLRSGDVVEGSEMLRIERRDALSGFVYESRTLRRGRDYTVDYATGRVLLASPLPIALFAEPLFAGPRPRARITLAADYETVWPGRGAVDAFGGRAELSAHGASLALSGLEEQRDGSDYRLTTARAAWMGGPLSLSVEAARSDGDPFSAPEGDAAGYALSRTGGLSFLAPSPTNADASADALAFRGRLDGGEAGAGSLWTVWRERGYRDTDSVAATRVLHAGAEGRAAAGDVQLDARAERIEGPDLRDPFGERTAIVNEARAGAMVPVGGGVRVGGYGSFASFERSVTADEGGRTAVGARASWQATPEVALEAGHQQSLWRYGDGPGALDDTFSSLRASLALREAREAPRETLSALAGWGPELGLQAGVSFERAQGTAAGYSRMLGPVDGAREGEVIALSGSRVQADDVELFVEQAGGRDEEGFRTGQAIGAAYTGIPGARFSVRYERGARLPFDGDAPLRRDAATGRVSLGIGALRLGLLTEGRREWDEDVGESDPDRWQLVGGLFARLAVSRELALAGRTLVSTTQGREGEERYSREATASAAIRLEPVLTLASYTFIDAPPPGSLGAPIRFHRLSLQPAIELGTWFRLASGVHVGFFPRAPATQAIAASLRPSVGLGKGWEVAVEGGLRSHAPEGERLTTARAEVGWRPEDVLGVALGYTLQGYTGTGVSGPFDPTGRLFLRLEGAF